VFLKVTGVAKTEECQDLGEKALSERLFWRYRTFLKEILPVVCSPEDAIVMTYDL
jgi:hypothetical protein